MSPGVTTKLHPGDRVQIPRWNRAATVLASRRGSLEIDVEGKKVTLSERDVLRVEPALGQQNTHAVPGWSAQIHEHEGSSDRLNIVGFRVDEGLAEVERFIDGASVSGQSIVTIIHGLGTGALKSAVTGYLKNHPLVAAIRSGEPAEGGAGVTIAELKK